MRCNANSRFNDTRKSDAVVRYSTFYSENCINVVNKCTSDAVLVDKFDYRMRAKATLPASYDNDVTK